MRRRSAAGAAPRICVGLGETAGYCARLTEGFRALGLAADHLNLGADPMRYGATSAPAMIRTVRWLAIRRRSAGPGARTWWAWLHRLAMAWLFLVAIRRYDAFVLRAGDSFFALRDLPLLRRLGKQVIVVFFGSDSRPSYLNGAEIHGGQDGATASATTIAKRRVVERIERHATHVVCHALSAQLHRRPAVAFLEVGIPRRIGSDAPEPPPATDGRPVRFLHAPSRPHDKGTDEIRAAVEAVRAEGIPVELRVVSGVSNDEVQAAIAECDVVIDQLWSDTPMAALAAEAAALGRPAVVGGYGWDELRAVTRPDAIPPTHLCHPDALADAIRSLATDEAERRRLGAEARRFVAERWNPVSVAERYLALLRDEAPEGWWFEPERVAYVLGAGAPEAEVRAAVRRVLEAAGPKGLAVDDRPDLLDRLLALVSEAQPAVTA